VSRDYFQPAAPHQVTVEEQWSCPARPAQPCMSGLTMTVDPTAGESTEEQEDSLVHGLSNMLEAPHPSPAARSEHIPLTGSGALVLTQAQRALVAAARRCSSTAASCSSARPARLPKSNSASRESPSPWQPRPSQDARSKPRSPPGPLLPGSCRRWLDAQVSTLTPGAKCATAAVSRSCPGASCWPPGWPGACRRRRDQGPAPAR